ncbi:alpha/beta hydrolase fold domain-containing protein [Brucepastera parasyntrophica]|uniref:alpha/beta hydrolase fold domain-containing protein n=1 Tax=Brucepastera parasyntrophica TaxID=2880008 RepID=UPI00210CA0DC|nr:alpha/beta hydrolase fold domain-containing protein [Brucepastera parasyntrophica]ULQ60915.1 alpha/beta hydrolase fold domain-containing protein [Brucepastera parasyntrophica]
MKKIHFLWTALLFLCGIIVTGCKVSDEAPSLSRPGVPDAEAGYERLFISWAAVTGADSYAVYYNTSNDSSSALKYNDTIQTPDITITGLENGVAYYVWVRAVNSQVASSLSEACVGTPSRTYRDLSYGSSSAQVLDIVFPENLEDVTPLNAILFIHGGGWQSGDKDVYEEAIMDNADNYHVITAAMNYRMFGEGADCADMLEDIDEALSLIKTKALDQGAQIDKIVLMGASAGAHLSLLYTYKNHSVSPIPIAFCVGQSTPADFTDPEVFTGSWRDYMLSCASNLTGEEITVSNYTGKTASLLSVSPVNYAASSVPPTLLAHGTNDDLVPVSNANRLKAALDAAGAVSDLFIYPNSGHELDNPDDSGVNTAFFTKMLEYIISYMGFYAG